MAQESAQPKQMRPASLNFVRDKAAEEDAFGAHDRLATTIAGVVRSNEDIKVIGLLGRWGSGKSTVISKLETELRGLQDGQSFHTFCYDAWLHQSDPQRRSFLEKFLRFLIAADLTTKEEWKDELNKLTRNVEETETTTTPILSWPGKVVVIALAVFAVAMQFVGYETTSAAFKTNADAVDIWSFWGSLGVITGTIMLSWAMIYFWLRPVRSPRRKAFYSWKNFTRRRSDKRNISIFGLFVNKAVETTRNRMIRDPEPTAIEFQNVFAKIMTAVKADNRRFVIVLDNLDRLHAEEALAMWGTVRSFFLGPNQENRALLPTVILPVDETAIQQIYSVEYGDLAQTSAEAFMEKTFDLTFHVPPPVATGWQAYLEKQLGHVFGDHLEQSWVFPVTRILEAKWRGQAITPRKINMAVNAIAALWLQRGDEISLPAIAYFCAFRPKNEGTVVSELLNPSVAVSHFDSDWQRNVAALHYGVAPEDAVQVLLRDRIVAALGQGHRDSFKALAEVKGFPTVLRQVLDESQTSPALPFVENTARYMSQHFDGNEPWEQNAWESIRSMAVASPDWSNIDESTVEAVEAMLKFGGLQSIRDTINGIAERLGEQSQSGSFSEQDYGVLASFARIISDACTAGGHSAPRIKLGGQAATYLDLIALVSDSELAMKVFQTTAKSDAVRAELIKGMRNPSETPNAEARLVASFKLELKLIWAGVIEAARGLVEQHSGGDESIRVGLVCLEHFVRLGNADAAKHIRELTDSGILSQRLSEAADAGKYDEVARIAALLLPCGGGIDVPNGWEHHLVQMATLPALIERYLPESRKPELEGLDHCDTIVAATKKTPSFLAIAKPIVSRRVRDRDLGLLYIEQVVSDLRSYLACVESDLHREFIVLISGYQSFWEELEKIPFGTHSMRLLSELAADGNEADEELRGMARELLGAKLSNVSGNDWEQAIRNEGDLLPTALTYAGFSQPRSVAGGLLDMTLGNLVPDLTGTFDDAARQRWFDATKVISSNARKTLLKNLRDRINGGATVRDLPRLLDIGGAAFIKNGEFAKDADSSVRHIVLPLVSEPDNIDWLLEGRGVHKSWVKASSVETRAVLSERLGGVWAESDADVRAKVEILALEYGLPAPSSL